MHWNSTFLICEKVIKLVLIPILYYSQCLISEEGNNTLYRREIMVWEGVEGARMLFEHIVESPFSTWNIYHA
jgi:hypothetical protein